MPTALYVQTLSSLVDTRTQMLTPDWIAALDDQGPEVRRQASLKLIDVQKSITALSNAILTDIAAQMEAQAADLTAADTALETALGHLEKVQDVLKAVTTLVTVVAKIVPLL